MTEKTTQKPKHLGRGLESLLGPIITDPQPYTPAASTPQSASNFPPDKHLRNSIREIALNDISANPYQPRTVWDQDDLAQLADSIKANGVIQPIIVRPAGPGYQLIAGERRFRAAELAACQTIPAVIRHATDEQLLELSLVENIHRTNLNPIERANAYRKYLTTFSLTQVQAAQRLGESRSLIANHLRLLDLPQEIKQMLADGKLTMGHARAILSAPTDQLRRKLANRAMAGRLSVREVEKLVRRYTQTSKNTNHHVQSAKPAHIVDLENRLTTELGAKVAIDTRRNGREGKIVIRFYSLDEFDRITERIGIGSLEEV